MLVFYLKRVAVLIFISTFTFVAKAQQDHFIYLQTENSKPFYVKLDNKVVSSSINGYLIISKLIDSDYNISIGFPKNEFPEENFKITIDKKDQGFLLKNFDDKGWGLFNMQSYVVTMGVSKNNFDTSSKNLQSDPFSKMLARVVKDSSILQKNERLAETTLTAKTDSSNVPSVSQTMSDTVVATKQQSALDTQVIVRPSITKIVSNKNEDGLEATYVDANADKGDTIKIFLPEEKASKNDSAIKKVVVQNDYASNQNENIVKPAISDSSSMEAKQKTPNVGDTSASTKNESLSKLDQSLNKDSSINQSSIKTNNIDAAVVAKDSTANAVTKRNDTTQIKTTELPKVVTSTTNSDCKAFARDEDFLKLRKKMAAESSDDEMINTARKAFHLKCFSTEQVKNLSFLFLTDKAKYMFFDTAYPFVSDSDQYFTLQSQIVDSYYANRFKAMVNK